MTNSDELTRGIAAIAADRERGATELAREALDVLQRAAEQGGAASLPAVAAALAGARPAMAALTNIVRRVAADPAAPADPSGACRRARAWLDESSRLAIEQAAAAMPAGVVIVTCSYSSAVVQACLRASSERRIRVRVLESRVSGITYGARVAARLREHEIPCEIVPDARPSEAMTGAAMALVGSDRVLPDGALVNGTPSRDLARAAHAAALPFYAICEAYKLDDARTLEPGFDLVPAGLIAGYLTADGLVPAAAVWRRGGSGRR